ncbi:MAG: hypothetical protein Q8O40_03005 [Chloroflexota bacterium]|nr:hypothetical protein [Chloroflexota bacterium]
MALLIATAPFATRVASQLKAGFGDINSEAALILVLVAASFSTAQVVLVKALGVGIAIAVLLDATLALMRVLGDWNWWAPRFLRRILPGQ